jgi:endonuclease/exonuclease/phosphatase family metal-dependent hydrolase
MTESQLHLATWNIHMGVGLDGRRDLLRIAEVIRHMEPDLIGLQEVDNHRVQDGDDLRGITGHGGADSGRRNQ